MTHISFAFLLLTVCVVFIQSTPVTEKGSSHAASGSSDSDESQTSNEKEHKRGVNASLPGVLDLGVLGGRKKRDLQSFISKRGANTSVPGVLHFGVLDEGEEKSKRGVNVSLPGVLDLGLLGGKKKRSEECSEENGHCSNTPTTKASQGGK